METSMKLSAILFFVLSATLIFPGAAQPQESDRHPVLQAMKDELTHSLQGLRASPPHPTS